MAASHNTSDPSLPTASSAPPARVDAAALQRYLRRAGQAPAPWLHSEIARRMAERLSLVLRQPDHVLDWWSPTSGSTAALQQQYPNARITAIGFDHQPVPPAHTDTATGRRWWQRLLPGSPSTSGQASTESAPAQLLWANMMLHWADNLPEVLARWHAAVAVDGFVMFSCFGPDTLRDLGRVYDAFGWGPCASAWTDMHDIGDAMVHAGFADPVMDMEHLTLTWDSPQALLAELRTLGSNTALARQPGLRGRQWQRRLMTELEKQLRGSDGRLHLRFEILYGHAFRPAARPKVQAETHVSLSDMREMTRRK